RFVGATFLHALCSGLVGYFLALAICRPKIKIVFVTIGLVIAAFLHGLYNFSIIEIEGPLKLLIPVAILISLTIFITIAFIKLKKMKSVCKI
ncbi:PrsW family intramembrane metalloprotease, partial [Patescibacteria group bacterium]|nr:PrsW family intramembrane metalloprotease [Patescibacteria group bacterium]